MEETFKVISPVDGSVYLERPYATHEAIEKALLDARVAQRSWRQTSLAERQQYALRFIDAFTSKKDEIAKEITWQMGRPIKYTPFEVVRAAERMQYMIKVSDEALSDVVPEPIEGFNRFIRRDPLGVVFVIAPWNYPYLTAINSIAPAILAGNSVILKHSSQTPLVAERFKEAFDAAGLPEGVFQFLHLKDDDADKMIAASDVDFVAFTGSVKVGHSVQKAASSRFIGAGLELGGKDPAYVRQDADVAFAIENLVDGSFFNSGQSCCGIERIYVHYTLYDEFLRGFIDLTKKYVLDNPTTESATLGPLVKVGAAEAVRSQIEEAIAQGATAHIDEFEFECSKKGTAYLAPQVLTNVDHTMRIMSEETFGPAIGIMKVESDEEAIGLMNDSEYGLTASIWTENEDAALRLGQQIETGTCFMNRCDYLDPALAWTGVKDSGRGCTLSKLGYEQLTRPKSYHLRLRTK